MSQGEVEGGVDAPMEGAKAKRLGCLGGILVLTTVQIIWIRYTIVYYPPRNFIRIRYTTIVVYYPPHNFKGGGGVSKKGLG